MIKLDKSPYKSVTLTQCRSCIRKLYNTKYLMYIPEKYLIIPVKKNIFGFTQISIYSPPNFSKTYIYLEKQETNREVIVPSLQYDLAFRIFNNIEEVKNELVRIALVICYG